MTNQTENLKWQEYNALSKLEQATTDMRHKVFTSLLSISFLIPTLLSGIADKSILTTEVVIFDEPIGLFGILFLFGFLFYCIAVYHYWWYHRYSHKYRKRLKELESELGINIYKLRTRPIYTLRFYNKRIILKAHFDWVLYIIGILYAYITISFIDILAFTKCVLFIILLYITLFLSSAFIEKEPLEK